GRRRRRSPGCGGSALVMRKHERGYVSNDGHYLIEKEEMETECHCADRPPPFDLLCPHVNQTKFEDHWFVYDLSKARPDDPTTLLDGRASGLTDAVFDADTLREVRQWLGES